MPYTKATMGKSIRVMIPGLIAAVLGWIALSVVYFLLPIVTPSSTEEPPSKNAQPLISPTQTADQPAAELSQQQINPAILEADIVEWQIEGRSYQLYRADTPEEHQIGLMNLESLPDDGVDGMLFVFPDAQPRSFWNMNTLMALKIYWMRDDQVVGTVDLPPITQTGDPMSVATDQPVNYVVEVVAGNDI